jgi:hypothetical protein
MLENNAVQYWAPESKFTDLLQQLGLIRHDELQPVTGTLDASDPRHQQYIN